MSDTITSRSNWIFNEIKNEYDITNLIEYYFTMMLNRTLLMFNWKNLPNNMNSYDVELVTQLKGESFLLYDKEKERYFILDGSTYDNITWNYQPSKAILINPSLPEINGNKYELGKNAIMIRNDYCRMGLYPILEKNSIDISNTDLSIKYANFNSRFPRVFTSDDDNTKLSLDKLIDDIWQGKKPTSIVTTNLYDESIKDKPYNNVNTDIHQLIELKQYQLAHWYMELGVNANYNMKSQYVNQGEMTLNDDALLPLIDNMLKCRKMACEEINKLFNLNIDVELSSSWLKIRDEINREIKKEELNNEIIEKELSKDGDSNESN